MNQFEHNILTRCLHVIYGQLLTDQSDVALESIEGLIYLVRYMSDNGTLQTTLSDELRAIREVFRIYRQNDTVPDIEIDDSAMDSHIQVQRTTIVYEICQHGMELIHNGIQIQKLMLAQNQNHLIYRFADNRGNAYGGTIYEERQHAYPEA